MKDGLVKDVSCLCVTPRGPTRAGPTRAGPTRAGPTISVVEEMQRVVPDKVLYGRGVPDKVLFALVL